MVVTVRRDSAIAETMPRRSPPTRVMSEAAIATSAPVPMAMPTSAAASAAASLMPSPAMATTCPCCLQLADLRGLLGAAAPRRARGRCRPAAAIGVRGGGVVAGEHPHLEAERLQLGDRLGGFGLDGVGDDDHGRPAAPSTATNIGVAPGRRPRSAATGQRGDVHAARRPSARRCRPARAGRRRRRRCRGRGRRRSDRSGGSVEAAVARRRRRSPRRRGCSLPVSAAATSASSVVLGPAAGGA